MNLQKCKHCGSLECYVHCNGSDDGEHLPADQIQTEIENKKEVLLLTLEFQCRFCKAEGKVSVPLTDIQWE